MTLRRGFLFSWTAVTLLAQDIPLIDKAKIDMAVDKAMQMQHEVLAHKNFDVANINIAVEKAMNVQREMWAHKDLLADASFAMIHAKEAMAVDKALFAMQAPLFQAARGGTPLTPDEEMKLMAIDGIMQSDSERALPLVDKVLQNPQSSIRLRLRALQAVAHSNSTKAREIVVRVAKDGSNTELQSRAIQLLGERESSQNKQLLGEIYSASTNLDIKRQVLRSWASAGAKDQILNVAKSDPNPQLREHAIRHLGGMRANSDLAALYASETSTEIRNQILRGLASADDWQKLLEIAKTEKNEELRNRAIQQAGSMRAAGVSEALVALYSSSTDTSTRSAILRSLSQQRNATQLIALARKETDPELKRTALQHLTRMKGDEVTTYLTELLEK